jgi:signal transduction histidine kinase
MRKSDPMDLEIIEALSDAVAIVDGAGIILSVNARWRTFLASRAARFGALAVGQNYAAGCIRALRPMLAGESSTLTRLGQGIRSVLCGKTRLFSAEYRLQMEGRLQWLYVEAMPLAHGHGALVLHRDVTAYRQMQERAADALHVERNLFDSSDHERQHIGALLHEGPCQTLSGMWLQANVLCEELSRLGSPLAGDARQIATLAKVAGTEIKKLLKDYLLLPMPLEDGEELMIALSYLGEQMELSGGMTCEVTYPKPSQKLEFADRTAPRHLFRIAQEAVRNASQYAGASVLKISLAQTSRYLVLKIEDNGNGFVATPHTSSALGLQMMNCRARAIGATLKIQTLKAGGASVVCRVPR